MPVGGSTNMESATSALLVLWSINAAFAESLGTLRKTVIGLSKTKLLKGTIRALRDLMAEQRIELEVQ